MDDIYLESPGVQLFDFVVAVCQKDVRHPEIRDPNHDWSVIPWVILRGLMRDCVLAHGNAGMNQCKETAFGLKPDFIPYPPYPHIVS